MKIILDVSLETDNGYTKTSEISLEEEDSDYIKLELPTMNCTGKLYMAGKIFIDKKQLKRAIDLFN